MSDLGGSDYQSDGLVARWLTIPDMTNRVCFDAVSICSIILSPQRRSLMDIAGLVFCFKTHFLTY